MHSTQSLLTSKGPQRFAPSILLAVLFNCLFLAVPGATTAYAEMLSVGSPAVPDTKFAQSVATEFWAVRLASGADPQKAAAILGATNHGQVGTLKNTYLFRIPQSINDRTDGATTHRLRTAPQILWFEQQFRRQHYKRAPSDPLYSNQWHLNNTGQSGGTAGQDANVVPAWNAGYLGTGVVIGIVDDGLQHTHPDISPNYQATHSYDFNGNDTDPSPVVGNCNIGFYDCHGTAVAGVAAARDDGTTCGTGVAYRAGIAGLRLVSLPTTDAQDATALSYHYDNIDIYSSSWGPIDDGANLTAPGSLTQAALADAVSNGRGGLGSIYVWAGGNGLQNLDNVNYDGYANSRYTIAVGAVDHNGIQSFYSEPGAALIVAAPSSNASVGITTTDLLGANGYSGTDCTSTFGGTSSATPLVAGTAALMLQANPGLGWRDVQHILARTAFKNDDTDTDWAINGAGHSVNHKYGFGRVNAAAAVTAATRRGRNLAATSTLDSGTLAIGLPIPENDATGVSTNIAIPENYIVEHVEVVFNTTHSRRGDLAVVLTSPSGTQSVLASLRNDSNSNYSNWRFMSARHWGELSAGQWTLRVSDVRPGFAGTFNSWQLLVYARPLTFTDVATSHFAWRWIEGLYTSGITSGCGTDIYCPDSSVTRQQMAVFLERGIHSSGYTPPPCTGGVFNDVPCTGGFFDPWIEQLAADGITTGCGGNNYCPTSSVTRQQMAIFLLRAKHGSGYTPPPCTGALFLDVPCAGGIFDPWIEQLAAEGTTIGCGAGNYCPTNPVTRAQMAIFLGRTFSLVLP